MDSKSSNLSSLGCDFVVATTQASINSGMLEYLAEATQPIEYICFLRDKSGIPSEQISLEKLKELTGGIDPFYIPDGTSYDDPRLKAISKAGFKVGIKMQMGLPPGVTPRDLTVVNFEDGNAKTALFNLYCSQLTVIDNTPPDYYGDGGYWGVWSQPSGQPWTAQIRVDLLAKDLDDELNTPYLNNHPKVKQQIKKNLQNLSGTAFSLQQLMYNLDSASLQTLPTFPTLDPKSDAAYVLGEYFVNRYQTSAKEHGLPLLSVSAVAQPRDESELQITAMERFIMLLKDGNGMPIEHGDKAQQSATTLNYLCAVNNHQLPYITNLNWNWVRPDEVNERSGMMAINRNVLLQSISDKVKEAAPASCYKIQFALGDDNITMSPGGTPTITIASSGSNVIHVEYSDNCDDISVDTGEWFCNMRLQTKYTCDITFSGQSINVNQEIEKNLDCISAFVMDPDGNAPGPEIIVEPDKYEWRYIDTSASSQAYDLSVNQNGALQLTKGANSASSTSKFSDNYINPDFDTASVTPFVQEWLKRVPEWKSVEIHGLEISQLHTFIFPGGKTFTYKNPFFSDNQDLVCEITYVENNEVSPSPKPQADQSAVEYTNPGPQPPPTTTVGKLTASTELMQNYIHGEIVSPTGKFEALQSSVGHSLLFAVDSSGIFHAIEEQHGTSHTGWQVHDLSSAVIQSQFPTQTSKAVVRTFDVSQSVSSNGINLMMAVSLDDGNEQVFVSLGNSTSDTSWVASPTWHMVPFDAVGEQSSQGITVANVFFAETQDGKQYLITDVDRGTKANPHITRYHIDPTLAEGRFWVKHDVSVDIAAGRYQSAVGRVSGKPIDGIYTAGSTGDLGQLVYEPIFNYYGSGPVAPHRLNMPGNAIPSAIATIRDIDDGSSDLYVVSGSTLHVFPSDSQEDGAGPISLFTNKLLSGTDTLKAMTHNGVVTLWGRNENYQVYYLTCPVGRVYEPSSWVEPVCILSDAERISCYMNCSDGGNTVFVSGKGQFQKLVQTSANTGKMWRSQPIAIATQVKEKVTDFKSYTTSINVTHEDTDIAIPNAVVNISTHTRTPVYINGLYYIISPDAIQVTADSTGSITIVEQIDSMNGAILTASIDNMKITINPMNQGFYKLSSMNSVDELRSAQLPRETVAGGVVDETVYVPLMEPSMSQDDLESMVESLGVLRGRYATFQSTGDGKNAPSGAAQSASSSIALVPSHRGGQSAGSLSGMVAKFNILGDFFNGVKTFFGDVDDILESFGHAIAVGVGDLFQMAKHGLDAMGQLFYDMGSKAVHFFVKVGEKIYHAALDGFHALAKGVEWLYNAAKTAWKTLVKFVEALFEWGDITRTKDIMVNMAKLWLQDQVDLIPLARDTLDKGITQAEKTLNDFAGVSGWSPSLANTTKKPASSSISGSWSKSLTPSSRLLMDMFRDHGGQLSIIGNTPTINPAEDLLNDLLAAVTNEAHVLGAVFNQLQDLIQQFASLTIEDILKKILAIVADGVLSSVQVVLDALLNVLYTLAQSAIKIMEAKIHIPVLSDLLNLAGFKDISFLDVFAWIGAFAVTVGYKTIEGHAPFPKDDRSVKSITAARSWDELCGMFGQQSTKGIISSFSSSSVSHASVVSNASQHQGPIPMSVSLQKATFECCHMISGILRLVGNPQLALEAYDDTGSSLIGIPATVVGIMDATFNVVGNSLVPMDAVESLPIRILSAITGLLVVHSKVTFSGVGQWAFKKCNFGPMIFEDARGIGAMLDGVLVIPAMVVTLWHFYELAQKPSGATRSIAIVEEVSSIASYVSRLAYAFAVNDEEPDSRGIALVVMAAANDIYGGLQVTEYVIDNPAFN